MEVQRAHFSLGTENSKLLNFIFFIQNCGFLTEMPKRSYGQDLIEQSVDQLKGNKNQGIEASERRKMVEMAR